MAKNVHPCQTWRPPAHCGLERNTERNPLKMRISSQSKNLGSGLSLLGCHQKRGSDTVLQSINSSTQIPHITRATGAVQLTINKVTDRARNYWLGDTFDS